MENPNTINYLLVFHRSLNLNHVAKTARTSEVRLSLARNQELSDSKRLQSQLTNTPGSDKNMHAFIIYLYIIIIHYNSTYYGCCDLGRLLSWQTMNRDLFMILSTSLPRTLFTRCHIWTIPWSHLSLKTNKDWIALPVSHTLPPALPAVPSKGREPKPVEKHIQPELSIYNI